MTKTTKSRGGLAGRDYVATVIFLIALLTNTLAAFAGELRYTTVFGAGNVPLNVVEAGARGQPSILFIHGSGQSYLSWHAQLDSSLSERFHLVAFDLRGHGASGKPWDDLAYNQACTWADDVTAVIHAAGLKKPLLVAWSYGGSVAMHYLRCRGVNDIGGIMLVNSRAGLVEVPLSSEPARLSQQLMRQTDLKEFLRGAAIFGDLMTAKMLTPELSAEQRMMNLMSPPYVRRAMEHAASDRTGRPIKTNTDLAHVLTLPTYIVLGGADPFRDSTLMAAAFKKILPAARVTTIPHVGHSPFAESPEAFNDLIVDSMKR